MGAEIEQNLMAVLQGKERYLTWLPCFWGGYTHYHAKIFRPHEHFHILPRYNNKIQRIVLGFYVTGKQQQVVQMIHS